MQKHKEIIEGKINKYCHNNKGENKKYVTETSGRYGNQKHYFPMDFSVSKKIVKSKSPLSSIGRTENIRKSNKSIKKKRRITHNTS